MGHWETSLANMTEEEATTEEVMAGTEEVPPESAKKVLMTDSYDEIIKLEDPAWKCEGTPNFRRLPGFPIFGTGQPAQADMEKCLEQVTKKYDEQKKVLWANLRQEPVVYVNGKSYSVRMSDDLNEHLVSNEALRSTTRKTAWWESSRKQENSSFTKI